MNDFERKLRVEVSTNFSGKLQNEKLIVSLKEKNYCIIDQTLDGDAPKQFIKAYFYIKESGIKKKNIKSWSSYIAKTAEKWYPHESVIEYMINRIGQEMGLVMNEVELVKGNEQIRFLSKYFLNKSEKLVHGAEICGEHLGDVDMAKQIAENKSTARDLFTFEFIKEAIESVFPNCHDTIIIGLVRMIAFDAIVGNNDRHFYNWGVIDTKMKSKRTLRLAPIYDSARALLWNFSDENLVKIYKAHLESGTKIDQYIRGACPRISIEGNKDANHFDLVNYIKKDNKKYKQIVEQICSKENEEKVYKMIEKEFFPYFIPERSKLVVEILKNRFKIIREL